MVNRLNTEHTQYCLAGEISGSWVYGTVYPWVEVVEGWSTEIDSGPNSQYQGYAVSVAWRASGSGVVITKYECCKHPD